MSNPEFHQCCTCGYEWKHGQHGGHDCVATLNAHYYALIEKNAELNNEVLALRDSGKRREDVIVELQRQLYELFPVKNMLILAGEDECKDIKNYADKLRAILDAMITYRGKLDELAKQEPVGVISSCSALGIYFETPDGTNIYDRLSVGDKLYRYPPNLPALIDQARQKEREACAKLCEENQVAMSSHDATLIPRLDSVGRHDGVIYAKAIRARKP